MSLRSAPKVDENYRAWIRRRPCILDELPPLEGHTCRGGVAPHHVKAKRRHGDWLPSGAPNLLPVCHEAHQLIHQHGRKTMELRWDLDFEKQAYRLGSIYLWTRRIPQVEAVLEQLAEYQPEALETVRAHDFVFETPLSKPDDELTEAERWEKLAFTFYTSLVGVHGATGQARRLIRPQQEGAAGPGGARVQGRAPEGSTPSGSIETTTTDQEE